MRPRQRTARRAHRFRERFVRENALDEDGDLLERARPNCRPRPPTSASEFFSSCPGVGRNTTNGVCICEALAAS
jgi:hypothetical protein